MSGDTNELTIYKPLNFINDFPSRFTFDTVHYEEFKFSEIKSQIVRITRSKVVLNSIIDTFVFTDKIFPGRNPFLTLDSLTVLKNTFGFIGTSFRRDIGDFIEFRLTPEYKLTYIPDTMTLNPKSKQYWITEFNKGEIVKPGWSLIKLYD